MRGTRAQGNAPASPTHRALYANDGSQVAIRGARSAGPASPFFLLSAPELVGVGTLKKKRI